jgi:nitroreductase
MSAKESAAGISLSQSYDYLIDVIRRRRSVRDFDPGHAVPRETLIKITEAGRWAPSGANSQPWDFVIVDDPKVRAEVTEVFLCQARRLVSDAKGFPAVMKTYLKDIVAFIIVLGDPRFMRCYPQGSRPESEAEYGDNNINIFFSSIGAAIQNIQLAVTALGLTSAWLTGGGEKQTNEELRAVLGYPEGMAAYGTIPIGYPAKDQALRYRRPLGQVVHWNRYDPKKYRPTGMIDYYVENLRPFAMYRHTERMEDWEDMEEKLGPWKDAFTSEVANPSGKV